MSWLRRCKSTATPDPKNDRNVVKIEVTRTVSYRAEKRAGLPARILPALISAVRFKPKTLTIGPKVLCFSL